MLGINLIATTGRGCIYPWDLTGATQKSCTLFHLMFLVHFLALKGRNIPARENALGKNISMV